MKALLLVALLAGCALNSEGIKPPSPEVRNNTITADVAVVKPCITDEDREKIGPLPRMTILPDTDTTEHLEAASQSYRVALEEYARKVDLLFIKCSGAKP